ncbi:sigma-54-dependent Fis family transcriptional regulator [candidate division KSB1 bacterium]|nr:sigma-54-dependent Fis family transcriptional regulator [candidate division KSB1 bacterium]
MKSSRILIVDDEDPVRSQLVRWLKEKKYLTEEASTGQEALEMVRDKNIAVMLLDLRLPDMNGLDVLRRLRQENSDVCVIFLTAFGTTHDAVMAIKLGAFDFLDKSSNMINELIPRIEKAREQFDLISRARQQQEEEKDRYRLENIIGKSRSMREIFDLIRDVAPSNASVLIQGESGTGKELVAHAIHNMSERADKPFIIANCAAMAEGVLESELFGHERGAFTGALRQKKGKCELADSGTLFIDEVGEIYPSLQVKLLRFLQDQKFERVGGESTLEVDARIIAATNKNLQVAIGEKKFREDLFFRLNVFPIFLPPLRERREDIPLLVDHFRQRYAAEMKKNIADISSSAMTLLKNYDYPGNVRELENIIERAVIIQKGEIIEADTLQTGLLNKPVPHGNAYAHLPFKDAKEKFEKEYIQKQLERTDGKILPASKNAGLDRKNFKLKLKKYGMINHNEHA